jgi:hypothetical protein
MDIATIHEHEKMGTNYLSSMGFLSLYPKCERFKAGDQWAPVTKATKDFPRPVINVIRYIENHKISSVINDPIKMLFNADDEDEQDQMSEVAAELFSAYSSTEWENVHQDELNEDAMEQAADLGAGIYHYFWDGSTITGKKRLVSGKLCGEILDPLNVVVGNPQCVTTQPQPYILIFSRRDIQDIKDEAKVNGIKQVDIDMITPDNEDSNRSYDTTVHEVQKKSTVLTVYWKELNGVKTTVHLMKVCGNTIIQKPIDTLRTLYPIVKINWYKRSKCWYGQGETEGLINNQKSVNYMVAMQMKSAEAVGMPKLMLKAGATNWNNDPSKAFIDNSGNPAWGAQYLQPSSISPSVPTLVDFLVESLKTLNGASESGTGDIGSLTNISPTVILSLQAASQVPIESIKKRYKRAMKDIGEIWQEFWTTNYNTTRTIMVKKLTPTIDPTTGQQAIDPMTGQPQTQEIEQPQDFKGTDFANAGLKLKIDVGTCQAYSDQLVTMSLDKLFDSKSIDTKTYVELYPENAMPYKNTLLAILDKQPSPSDLMAQQQIPGQQPNTPISSAQ